MITTKRQNQRYDENKNVRQNGNKVNILCEANI